MGTEFREKMQKELSLKNPKEYEHIRKIVLAEMESKYSNHPVIKYLRQLQEKFYSNDPALWNQVNRMVHDIFAQGILEAGGL